MHYVGLDEAHEMCINKESKSSITRPTKDNMGNLVHFFPYRSKALQNLKDQLKITRTTTPEVSIHQYSQELMSGEAAKECVTPVPSKSKLLMDFRFGSVQCASCGASASKKKASPNGEGSRDLQIYHVFVANRFHCHPFAWPFHCG